MSKSVILQFGTVLVSIIFFGILCAGHFQFVSPLSSVSDALLQPLHMMVTMNSLSQMLQIAYIGLTSLIYGLGVSFILSMFAGD